MRIRAHTYRGVHGWLLYGWRSPIGSPCRIFFEHETAARRVLARKQTDRAYQTTTEDFLP